MSNKSEFDKTFAEMRAESPLPWRVNQGPMGLMSMHDANGVEVPMLRMLATMAILTSHIASQPDVKP